MLTIVFLIRIMEKNAIDNNIDFLVFIIMMKRYQYDIWLTSATWWFNLLWQSVCKRPFQSLSTIIFFMLE